MHADSLESAIKRLQQKPMDIPPAYTSLMNCALVVRRVKDNTTGQSTRRVITISEIISSDESHPAYSWDARSDVFRENLDESVLLKRMSEATGKDVSELLEEHKRRVRILKWLVEQEVRDFRKVAEVVGKYYRDPQAILSQLEA